MSNRTELHDKIQQITAKIIDLNMGFASKPALSKLDTDLLQKYTVDLYDAVLQLNNAPEAIAKHEVVTPSPVVTAPVLPPVKQPEPEKQVYVEPAPPKIEAELPKVVEQPVLPPPVVETPAEPIAQFVPVVEEKPVAVPPPSPVIETKPVAQPVVSNTVTEEVKEEFSLNDRLQTTGEGNDLASKMQQTPIHDLKKAISINKKFEFINQLFKGDHEAYAKSIHYINGLTNGAEANTFFNNLRKQFAWEEENKLFLELAEMIRRRFM